MASHAGQARGLDERPHLLRAVQDVALDAEAGEPGAGSGERGERGLDTAPRSADVMAVHHPDQVR